MESEPIYTISEGAMLSQKWDKRVNVPLSKEVIFKAMQEACHQGDMRASRSAIHINQHFEGKVVSVGVGLAESNENFGCMAYFVDDLLVDTTFPYSLPAAQEAWKLALEVLATKRANFKEAPIFAESDYEDDEEELADE